MFWLLLPFLQPTFSVPVLKCCPQGQSWHDNTGTCVLTESVARATDMMQGISWQYEPLSCPLQIRKPLYINKNNSVIESGHLILIEHGNISFSPRFFCIDNLRTDAENMIAHVCPCSAAQCMRKCCPLQQAVQQSSDDIGICIESDKEFHPMDNPDEDIYFIYGMPDCGEAALYLKKKSDNGKPMNLTLEKNGDVRLIDTGEIFPFERYCSDLFLMEDKIILNLVLCFNNTQDFKIIRKTLYNVLLIVGSVFLLLTLVVQYSLPELRLTLHSKNLSSQSVSLLMAYMVLLVQSLGYTPMHNTVLCIILGHLLQYAFLAAFFWLNVMCVDITWTFSGFRIPEGNSLNESEGKKYLYYSSYAWGSSAIIVLATFMTDMLGNETDIAPKFGNQKCWFKEKLPTLIFFYLPITILLLINVILFAYTSLKIISVRRDTVTLLRQDGMRPTCSNFQRFSEFRFTLYLKLSILMGIAWLIEVITWAVDDENNYYYLYVIGDSINGLRGVFVFFLFCRKRKLVELLRSKVSSASGMGHGLRKRKTENSSTKSSPGDSSTLYTCTPTQQTQVE